MSDILVRCRKCGRETKVSEYAASGEVRCPGCGTPLEFSAPATQTARLKLKQGDTTSTGRPTGPGMRSSDAGATAASHTAPKLDVLSDVHKSRQSVRNPLAIWNWLAFVLLGGALVGAEYYVTVINSGFLHYYLMGRWGIWGFVALLVLIVAFEDGTAQGLLCLFAPMYIVYYALVRLEYYWLRGLFMAVLVGIGMELYYLPERSAVVLLQREANAFVAGVSKQIERASESPDVPPPPPKMTRMQRWQMQSAPKRD
jgi:phage FluMu protein Com